MYGECQEAETVAGPHRGASPRLGLGVMIGDASGAQRPSGNSSYAGHAADEQAPSTPPGCGDQLSLIRRRCTARRIRASVVRWRRARGRDRHEVPTQPPRNAPSPAGRIGGELGQPAASSSSVSTSLSSRRVDIRAHVFRPTRSTRARSKQSASATTPAAQSPAYQAWPARFHSHPIRSSTPCSIGGPRPTACWIAAVNSASP